MAKWKNEAGPRRIRPVDQLLRNIDWQARTELSDYGARGRFETTPLCGANRPEPMARLAAVGERFGWVVTVANIKEVTAALQDVLSFTMAGRPVIDKRQPAEIVGVSSYHNGD